MSQFDRFQLPDLPHGHRAPLTRHKPVYGTDGDVAECGMAPSGKHCWSAPDSHGEKECLWCRKKVDSDKKM